MMSIAKNLELRTKKEYEINREEWKVFNDTSFREDIRSLIQQLY